MPWINNEWFDAAVETAAHYYGVGEVVPVARAAAGYAAPLVQSAITSYYRSNKAGAEPSQSNSPAEPEDMSKRKATEEHGMEPHGHGNNPAAGTLQANYIQKYVPRNFPDKQTVDLRFCNAYTMRTAATAGALSTAAYLTWRTNSMNGLEFATSGAVFNNLATSHPNQFTGVWKTLYGYYRVEQFKFKIHVSNIANSQFTETAAPAFTGNGAMSDAIVTLLPTQTSTDLSAVSQQAAWEQKESHNIYLQSRSPGSLKSYHCFAGVINPEDYDIDPITTGQDETWTAVASNPTLSKLIGLSVCPAAQYTTTALLPEVILNVFVEFDITVQFAGYLPALRQAIA